MRRLKGDSDEYFAEDRPFADGRTGLLYRCRGGFVFKEYREPVGDTKALQRLRRLRQLGRKILIEEGQPAASSPEASINWPVDLVIVGGQLLGVILLEIPRRFYREPGSPRTLDWMLLARGDRPRSSARLSILIRLCEIFMYLEERNLVHGDISSKNVVWSRDAEAYALDADGLQPRRPRPTSGLMTPRWTDPRLVEGLIPAHDHYSDRYALSLAIYRGLLLNPGNLDRRANGRWPAPASLPPDLEPSVHELLSRALGNPLDERSRPTPARWADVLTEAFVRPTGFDRAELRVLDDAAAAQIQQLDQRAPQPPRPRQGARSRPPTRPAPAPSTTGPAPGGHPRSAPGPSIRAIGSAIGAGVVSGVVGLVVGFVAFFIAAGATNNLSSDQYVTDWSWTVFATGAAAAVVGAIFGFRSDQ